MQALPGLECALERGVPVELSSDVDLRTVWNGDQADLCLLLDGRCGVVLLRCSQNDDPGESRDKGGSKQENAPAAAGLRSAATGLGPLH